MPNWKDSSMNETVLAALVAYLLSQNIKLNYQTLATLIGGGATYDAVEGRFRKIKKDAGVLQAEVDSGERPPAPIRGGLTIKDPSTPRKQRTPRAKSASQSSQNGVVSGRVSKSNNNTPTKKRAVKHEILESSASSSAYGDAGIPMQNSAFAYSNLDAVGYEMPGMGGMMMNPGAGYWNDDGI